MLSENIYFMWSIITCRERVNVEDEFQLYANYLFYVMTIYGKSLLLQFLSRGILVYISILTDFFKTDAALAEKFVVFF